MRTGCGGWRATSDVGVARATSDVRVAPGRGRGVNCIGGCVRCGRTLALGQAVRDNQISCQLPQAKGMDKMPDDKDKFDIIINAREVSVNEDELSFDGVVKLAFPTPPSGTDIHFIVTFRNGAGRPPEGTLTEGHEVKIQDGTVFDVTPNDRS